MPATAAEPFAVLAPPDGVARAPLVVHVPHASPEIPPDVRNELLVSDLDLAEELRRLTDWYTDELFAGLASLGATQFVNRLSRLVFDPERFADDAAEPAEAYGQGIVYWRGTRGQPLRAVDPQLRARRIEKLYRPYHAALDHLVGELLAEFGGCTIIDGHSFPTEPLPSEVADGGDRPDICIGTDPVHTPDDLAAALEQAFRAEGLAVRRNVPFAGAFVPSGFYGREPRVRSVMIEVRRALYMDERTERPTGELAAIRGAIERCVRPWLDGPVRYWPEGQPSS